MHPVLYSLEQNGADVRIYIYIYIIYRTGISNLQAKSLFVYSLHAVTPPPTLPDFPVIPDALEQAGGKHHLPG